jgi:molybdopterin converting factor small subunit
VTGDPRDAATAAVPVEVIGWPTRFVGGDGSARRVFDEPLGPGATVRSVLRGLSGRFPALAEALWHGDELGEHIEVLVNDAVLGIGHTLDSPLRQGDRITLLAQFMGGGGAATASVTWPRSRSSSGSRSPSWSSRATSASR